jgi:hypothetical protein
MDKDKNFKESEPNLYASLLAHLISAIKNAVRYIEYFIYIIFCFSKHTLSNLETFRVDKSNIVDLDTDAKLMEADLTYNSEVFNKAAIELIKQGKTCYEHPWAATGLLDNCNLYHDENLLSSDLFVAKDLVNPIRDINNDLQIGPNLNLENDCTTPILKVGDLEGAARIENSLVLNAEISSEVLGLGSAESRAWSGNKFEHLPFPESNPEKFGLNKMDGPINGKLFSKGLKDEFLRIQTYESKFDLHTEQGVNFAGLNTSGLCEAPVILIEPEKSCYRQTWKAISCYNISNIYQDAEVVNNYENITSNLRVDGRWRLGEVVYEVTFNSRINNKSSSLDEIGTGILPKAEEQLNVGSLDTTLEVALSESQIHEKLGTVNDWNKIAPFDTDYFQKPETVNNFVSNQEIDNRLSGLGRIETNYLMAGEAESLSLLESNPGNFAWNKMEGAANAALFNKDLKGGPFESQAHGKEFTNIATTEGLEYMSMAACSIERNTNGLELDSLRLEPNFKNNLKPAVYNYDNEFIVEITKINSKLADIYKGAFEANYTKHSDYKRHVAHSLRELISNTIRFLAPKDKVVKNWVIESNRSKELLHDEEPTRRARILYIYRERPKRERKLIEDDARSITRLYNLLNKPSHKLSCNVSEKLLDNYFEKVKNALETIVLLYNHP